MKRKNISLTAIALLLSIGGSVLANVKTVRKVNEQCRKADGTILSSVPPDCNKTAVYCCTGLTTGTNYFHQ